MCHVFRSHSLLAVITASVLFSLCSLVDCLTATADVVLQNDSITGVANGTPLNAFIPNEQAASWFAAPFSGNVVGVELWWGSVLGGAPPQLELAIHIYSGGAFPTPGPPAASIILPTLSDGSLNQFFFVDPPGNNVPLQVPVTNGQTFVVAVEFLNQNAGNPFASTILIDQDGCQASTNSVFAIPGGWSDACALGVTGDFGIRAIVRPIPEPGTLLLLLAFLPGAALLTRIRQIRD